jgi:hypothetical protein
VDGLYSEREVVPIETEVTFEDGRKAKTKAEIRISEAARIPVAAARSQPEQLRKAG